MPIMLGVCGAVGSFSAKSLVERMLFYSVTAASLAEIVVIKAMLWLGQPWLMLAVFFLNAFMTVQFLRYGVLVSAMNRSETD
jgi:predicted MFS family arabinose efflux permease